ncbi:MAG: vanadium-dependent haloperoxidase [Chloroflexota bacterium]
MLMLLLMPLHGFAQVYSIPAADQNADVALAWMDLTYRLVQSEAPNAPEASRIYAYAGVTLYEAVVAGMPDNSSLASSISSMPDMPLTTQDQLYDWPTVANVALAKVIPYLFLHPSDATLTAISDLRTEQIEARKQVAAPDVVRASMKYGSVVADALLEWISKDGYQDTRNKLYTLPSDSPSDYILTRPDGVLVEPYWGEIRPFALPHAAVCTVPTNMTFDIDPSSAFYAQAMEVKNVGDNLTDEQKAIARYWLDTPGQTGAPSGHWVSIENQIVTLRNLNLQQAAGMYALVGMALGDAFISAWELKYEIPLLRPVTYIQTYIRRSWQPYIQSPMFPEYPSGHSVASEAAAEVLTNLFGVVAFTDRTHIIYHHDQAVERSFTSFEAAATEAAISRLYGGIHYRQAIENGLRQGRCVGDSVVNNIQLGPIPQGE